MAKLIQLNVPSTNYRKSRTFYGTLFGDLDFAQSITEQVEAHHQPISSDGIQLTITPRQAEHETITAYFAVDDLNGTLSKLEHAGGVVVREPFTLHIASGVFKDYETQVLKNHPEIKALTDDIGRAAIILDPDGNLIGLTELRPQAHWLFKYGQHRTALDTEQLAQHKRGIELGSKVKIR
jgi:predicted enzyme related to lactoylglutathione lyase